MPSVKEPAVESQQKQRLLSLDALLLAILVVARVRVDTLANLAAPRAEETIKRLPLIGSLLGNHAWDLMRNWLTDPLSLLLITLTFALLGLYLLVDVLRFRLCQAYSYRLKLALTWAITLTTIVAQGLFLILMRHETGPASFTHDGGVIQTELAADMLWQGRNPYTEDYLDTPLAEWGLEKRTALYHYPYLPWTLALTAPVQTVVRAAVGWYDQRFLYLALFLLMLALLPRLAANREQALVLVAVVALNPVMGNDVIFGMNDSFVLAWLVIGLWYLSRQRYWWAAVAFGLAWASKPIAWFIAPFYIVFLGEKLRPFPAFLHRAWSRGWPALAVFLILVLPFLLWDAAAMLDDVWAWSAGTSSTSYQIRGWGFSNLVLALGLVPDNQAYFPFWIPQLLVCVPLLALLLRWQARSNTASHMLYAFAVLFGVYSYFSRFFNENYVGFFLSLLALAACAGSFREVQGEICLPAEDSLLRRSQH